MLRATSDSKGDIRLKCPLIFNSPLSTIMIELNKNAIKREREKLSGAQLFTIRTETLLCKGLSRLQKYDFNPMHNYLQ